MELLLAVVIVLFVVVMFRGTGDKKQKIKNAEKADKMLKRVSKEGPPWWLP